MGNRFVCGLDLGQSQDFTALAAVECTRPEPNGNGQPQLLLAVRHLERWPLGTSYVQIAEDVKARFADPPLQGALLAVDKTGVSAVVLEVIYKARPSAQVRAITITAGHAVTKVDEGLSRRGWHVPKKDLVAGQTGHEEFGSDWRERAHDDLVLAVALAGWLAQREPLVTSIPPPGIDNRLQALRHRE